MIMWFLSRLASYLVFIEFFSNLQEFSARGLVTVKKGISFSELVDIVDREIPVSTLVLYELILIFFIFLIILLAYKIFHKSKRETRSTLHAMYALGKVLAFLGVVGLISRILTYISIDKFFTGMYAPKYTALNISTVRDALYIFFGIIISNTAKNQKKITIDENLKNFVCTGCGTQIHKFYQTCPHCKRIGMIKEAKYASLHLSSEVSTTKTEESSILLTKENFAAEIDEPEAKDTLSHIDKVDSYQKNASLFCRKCGAKLFEDSEFCHKCGTKTIES